MSKNNHGGKREGAGRKPLFMDSETITIRIPKGTKDKVKEFVLKLREELKKWNG